MLARVVLIFTLIGPFSVLAKDTELKFYRPFVDGLKLQIKKKIRGECWQQSQRIKKRGCLAMQGRGSDL